MQCWCWFYFVFVQIFLPKIFNLKSNRIWLLTDYGTGSYPCLPQGWQLLILLSNKYPPLKGPCFFIASTPYCEHVGEKRQVAAYNGDIAR